MSEKKSTMKWGCLLGIFVASLLMAVPSFGQPPEGWTTGIAYDVVPEAKITKVGWSMGKTEAGEWLIFEVGIKNVSDKPWRFKLIIYPVGTDAIAGLYPWDKPSVKPNQELVQKFPVFLKEMPGGFALVVKKVEE